MSASNRSGASATGLAQQQNDAGERQTENQPAENNEADTAGNEAPAPLVTNTPTVETVSADPNAYRAEQRADADLQAQQDMALYALLMFVASLLTVGITAVGVWFVKRTLDATLKAVEDTSEATDAMREANEIARARNTADLRPYVGIESVEIEEFMIGSDPRWAQAPDVPRIHIEIKVKVKNVGKGIANHVQLILSLCEFFDTKSDLTYFSYSGNSVTLFPEQTATLEGRDTREYEGFFKRKIEGRTIEVPHLFIAIQYSAAVEEHPFVLEEFWGIGREITRGQLQSFGRNNGEFGVYNAVAKRSQVIDPGNLRRPAKDDNGNRADG